MEEKHFCEYGCGQQAKFQLKNGRWCCCKSYQSCPELKKKNSNANKDKKKTYKNGHPRAMLGKRPWNYGLTKNDDERLAISDETRKKLRDRPNKGRANSVEKQKERIRKISETSKRNGISGGKRHGSGRGKKGWYKGYWCDSSWELAYVIYNLQHGIKFERNKQGFEYEYNGRRHKFYPDFILEDETYVEIKGAMTEQNKVKISSFCDSLIVLDKYRIKPYLDYVKSKYGKNFFDLYEI